MELVVIGTPHCGTGCQREDRRQATCAGSLEEVTAEYGDILAERIAEACDARGGIGSAVPALSERAAGRNQRQTKKPSRSPRPRAESFFPCS